MHLRSITLKGFKSFPERTRLEFAPGVSVIVGPNGSGKSNITDAVLWALGEQSPLAVRGQSMQDVIFVGGHGLPGRSAAEVEVVLDNTRRTDATEFSELSIVRRLERSGAGEYRLNGARCRLADILELLSDTGLGKEMHSVVSQGRVEAIVHSQPGDRRLLIEEAAGLGKHRKRRRRAELKLKRTEDNLARALDVEREARLRLRPLKRQAEAADLHERLERQTLEARLELVGERVRVANAQLDAAEAAAASARLERDARDRELAEVGQRRQAAEERLEAESRAREELSGRLHAAASARDRIELRLERARELARTAVEASARREAEARALEAERGAEGDGAAAARRAEALEAEMRALDVEDDGQLTVEVGELQAEAERLARARDELAAAVEARRAELSAADAACDSARADLAHARQAVEAARRQSAEAGGELAALREFLRRAAPAADGANSLADELETDPDYRLAVAAVIGPRLRAPVVDHLDAGEALLDRAGESGGQVVVSGAAPRRGRSRSVEGSADRDAGRSRSEGPVPGARQLLDHVRPSPRIAALAARLLADVWVVESLAAVPGDFAGVAVTRQGRLLRPSTGDLRQAARADESRLLEELARRDRLVASSEEAARRLAAAEADAERALEAVGAADAAREAAERGLRATLRAFEDADEQAATAARAAARLREEPRGGPGAVRRAELAAELRAERRLAEGAERERARRKLRLERLRRRAAADHGVAKAAERAAESLEAALAAVAGAHARLESEWRAAPASGEGAGAELRRCAAREAELQAALRRSGDALTAAEVAAQRARDAAAEQREELKRVAAGLGREPAEPDAPLDDERRAELEGRVERLTRRREQLGPVNPLAQSEYEEAAAHAEELESQRTDLQSAMAELQSLIRETDRRIRESFDTTFEATAKHFADVVEHLFPGGRGRLRLVSPEGPRPVIGGVAAPDEPSEPEEVADQPPATEPGVEVEVTPAGKSTKRLSLLSGGEKSLVALAFTFAVFLARPCPFYILDEVEAALDDLNIDRFLQLLRRYSDRAQFIVVTHQRRTMDAADRLYGVSMGADGVSKVVSRRLAQEPEALASEAVA